MSTYQALFGAAALLLSGQVLADFKTLRVSDQTGTIVIDDNSDWDEILIPKNTVLRANIHVLKGRTKDVSIRGESRFTSVIAPNGWFGKSDHSAKGKRAKMLGNIYSDCKCTVSMSNFTSRNSKKYHILGDSNESVMIADNLYIHNRIGADNSFKDYHTTDGFGGGVNSLIRNTEIDTFDDSVKIYRKLMNVEGVTIYHNKNGSPYQFGWGGFDYAKGIFYGYNRVIDNFKKRHKRDSYHHGVFGWVKTNKPGLTRDIEFLGPFEHSVTPGKDKSFFYTFGKNIFKKPAAALKKAEVRIAGPYCVPSTLENTENRGNGPVSVKLLNDCSSQ